MPHYATVRNAIAESEVLIHATAKRRKAISYACVMDNEWSSSTVIEHANESVKTKMLLVAGIHLCSVVRMFSFVYVGLRGRALTIAQINANVNSRGGRR